MEEQKEKVCYYETLLKKEWSYNSGAVVMTVIALMMASFAGAWGVSGPLASWGGKILTLIGINADSWKMYNGSLAKFKFLANQPSITDVSLALGALTSCLLAAQWKLRNIKSIRQVWAAVIGGTLMGIGARIAPGCNIGALFSSLPQYSLSGWIFLVFVFAGATVGGKVLTAWFLPPVSHERRDRKNRPSPEQRKRNRTIQITIGVILLVLFIIFAINTKGSYPNAGFFLFIGLGIGYAMQRSRLCFTAAYRDPTLTGSTKLTKAVIVALAIASIGFAGIHMSRYGADLSKLPETVPGGAIGLHLLIGAFIFGIGAVLAGGCASGTFIRVGEGYVQSMIALVFFIVGSMIGTPIMSAIQKTPFLYSGTRVYLPKLFGGFGPAILIQLLALLCLWILADWWERKKTAEFNK
ncbi:YeeE/YedE family protein [Treponema sp. OttesenSCG-928-L16]|nr:YeeE/YedE family protein [Treponema sp. OttesenSCG-928-L16]